MKRRVGTVFAVIIVFSILLITCDTFFFQPTEASKPICKAYISDSLIAAPRFEDTLALTKIDTVRTGAEVLFAGIVVPYSATITYRLWSFGDGTGDTGVSPVHRYLKGGVYSVEFRILDNVGGYLADTVRVHVNTPPDSVKLLSPINGAEIGTNTYPSFFWTCSDADSGTILHYAICIGTELTLNDAKIKSAGITATNYALWNCGPSQNKYYWRVIAHDNYDSTLSAIDSFAVVDYSLVTGSCYGFVKLQGVVNHANIIVKIKQVAGAAEYSGTTDSSGFYSIRGVFPGSYNFTAAPPAGRIFVVAQKSAEIIIRKNVFLDTITLKDIIGPAVGFISPINNDTLKNLLTRTPIFNGTLNDSGSGIAVDSLRIFLNGDTVKNAIITATSWLFSRQNIADGRYLLRIISQDSAGNKATYDRSFFINSKTISAAISPDTVSINDSMVFTATTGNLRPGIARYSWNFDAGRSSVWDTTMVTANSVVSVKWASPDSVSAGRAIVMAVDDSEMSVFDTVNYTILRDAPKATIQGVNSVKVRANAMFAAIVTQRFGSIVMYKWDDGISPGWDDSSSTMSTFTKSYLARGAYVVRLYVRDDDNNADSTFFYLSVTNDNPVVTGLVDDTISINDALTFTVFATDPEGIRDYQWDFNNDNIIDTVTKTNGVRHIFPSTPQIATVVVSVHDSCDGIGKDTAKITVLLDAPVASIAYPADNFVSIYDSIVLTDNSTDHFGTYTRKWYARGIALPDTGATVKFVAGPNAEIITCKLVVTDDDNLKDSTSIFYNVVQDIPVTTLIKSPNTPYVSVKDTIILRDSTINKFGTYKRQWSVRGTLLPDTGGTIKVITGSIAETIPCTLVVTDDDNQRDTASVTFDVRVCPPLAIAKINHDSVWAGDQVILLTTGSKDSNTTGRIVEYAWKMDTATSAPWKISSGADTTITTALASGVIKIILRVTDDDGLLAFDTVVVFASLKEVYVDSAATGANTGGSWANAFTDLQNGLAVARYGSKIYVAIGTYYPSTISVADRNASFILKNGVKIFGGYPRGGGARDTGLCEVVLSGDIQRDGDVYNNSQTVLKSTTVIDTATLSDGLKIIGGFGGSNGGGAYINGSPTLTSCIFASNSSSDGGGGIYINSGSPTLTNCTFTSNSSSNVGGGIFINNASPTMTNCTFTSNSSSNDGGGIFISSGSSTLTNCTFTSNSSNRGGGGGIYISNGSSILANCTFSSNSSSDYSIHGGGGGVKISNGSSIFTNCVFTSNSNIGYGGGGGVNICGGSPVLTNCTFTGNNSNTYNGGGGGIFIYGANATPIFSRCIFNANAAPSGGAIYSTSSAAPTMNACRFTANRSSANGGVGYFGGSHGRVTGSVFSDNIAAKAGALFFSASDIKVTNCIFIRDSAAIGGACYDSTGSKTSLTNCTFFSNVATASGGAICDSGTSVDSAKSVITNCLFWANTAPASPQILGSIYSFPAIKNCLISGGYTGPGTTDSIITLDPVLSPLADNGGPVPTCAIGAASPARNAGTGNVPPGVDISTDARGMPRGDGKPDIGAFEVQ